MERERCCEGIASIGTSAIAKANFGEMQDRSEMARLELERAPDVREAFLVAAEQVVERGSLVPCLGVKRRAAQERRQSRFGDVVTTRSDVARRRLQRGRRGAV